MLIWHTNAECHIKALKKLAVKHNLVTTDRYLQIVVNYYSTDNSDDVISIMLLFKQV